MLKRASTHYALALALLMSNLTLAQDKENLEASQFNFPGGVIQFNIEKQSNNLPEVKYGLAEPAIMDRGGSWGIIIGVGLDTLPGEYVVYIKHDIKDIPGLHKKIFVRHHNYPYVEAKAKKASQYQGIYAKYESLSSINFSNTQEPSLPFRLPLEGEWSNYFGHNIKVNSKQQLVTPNAVSLMTTQLASVRSPQNAIVSKIETTEDGLKRVFLDHGRGVYSIISGLSDLTIDVSNGIVAGAVIGKLPSGKKRKDNESNINASTPNNIKSRRLIWQAVMNGEYVNPLLLTKLSP